jgi:hypothetical protein
MSDYKLYLLDSTGRIAFALDFEGADDQAAIAEAAKHLHRSAVEIWHRTRLVARLEKQ